MVATAVQQKKASSSLSGKISWETFQKRYLTREDKYKYEWVDGRVEKTNRTMDKSQFYLQDNLIKFLSSLTLKHSIDGQLIADGDTFFSGQHRRPGIAYYTRKQIIAASNDENIVPQFVIEIISSKDQINKVHKKMHDYRTAKVQIIWHVFPDLEEVHVYRNHGKKMEVRTGDDICSAEPVIEGFKISVHDIFKKN